MQFSLTKLSVRQDSPLPSFSSIFPATDTLPIDASMTLGGLPPLQEQENNPDVNTGDSVEAVAGANEIVTAFESLDAEDAQLSKELQCRYRKGKCSEQRTLKKNGSLHSYCEYHRELSVRNQRVFDQKRRRKRGLEDDNEEKLRPHTGDASSAPDAVKTDDGDEKRPSRRRRTV